MYRFRTYLAVSYQGNVQAAHLQNHLIVRIQLSPASFNTSTHLNYLALVKIFTLKEFKTHQVPFIWQICSLCNPFVIVVVVVIMIIVITTINIVIAASVYYYWFVDCFICLMAYPSCLMAGFYIYTTSMCIYIYVYIYIYI